MTAHTWLNGLKGGWRNGLIPTGTDFRTLDQSLFGCVNADGGGGTPNTPWTPSATIRIGGAGMWAAGPWTLGGTGGAVLLQGTGSPNLGPQTITSVVNNGGLIQVNVSGPFGSGAYANGDLVFISGVVGTTEANGWWQIAALGGGSFTLTGSAFVNAYISGGIVTEVQSVITFGDNDYFVLQAGHSAQSRTIVTPCATAQAIPSTWSSNPLVSGGQVYGLQSLAPGAGMDVPLRVHNGATIAGATLTFFVGQSHSGGVPASLPGVRLVAMNMAGQAFPLATTAVTAGTDATGMQFVPTPASGSAWFNSGGTQTFAYTCDPGLVIDTTQYSYHAVVQDEFGANALTGNIYVELALSFTGIADQRPQ